MKTEPRKTGALPRDVGVTQQPIWVQVLPDGTDGLKIIPPLAKIPQRGKVKWDFKELKKLIPAGGHVKIDFDEWNGIRGPFEKDSSNSACKERGRYKKEHEKKEAQPLIIDSNKADQNENPPQPLKWKYTVTACYKDGSPFRGPEDPGIEIEQGGGMTREKK